MRFFPSKDCPEVVAKLRSRRKSRLSLFIKCSHCHLTQTWCGGLSAASHQDSREGCLSTSCLPFQRPTATSELFTQDVYSGSHLSQHTPDLLPRPSILGEGGVWEGERDKLKDGSRGDCTLGTHRRGPSMPEGHTPAQDGRGRHLLKCQDLYSASTVKKKQVEWAGGWLAPTKGRRATGRQPVGTGQAEGWRVRL